jgi:hypothetical protein
MKTWAMEVVDMILARMAVTTLVLKVMLDSSPGLARAVAVVRMAAED